MTDPRKEATRAVEELEAALARKKEPLDRYLARTVLVSLGELALAERADEAAALAARVKEASAPREEEWRTAVTFELRLAASEHIQAIDLDERTLTVLGKVLQVPPNMLGQLRKRAVGDPVSVTFFAPDEVVEIELIDDFSG